MSTASELDGAFQEVFLLGISKLDGAELQFAATTEEVTPEQGEKDIEGVPMGNGGRKVKRTPEGDFEWTFKIWPLSVDSTDLDDMAQFFLGGVYDSTTAIAQVNTRGRDLFRIVWLQTDDSVTTAASGTTATSFAARRLTVTGCRCTSYKESWDDKMLTAEVKFKAPAFDLSGTGTITRESVKSTDATSLPLLAAYT